MIDWNPGNGPIGNPERCKKYNGYAALETNMPPERQDNMLTPIKAP